MTEQQSGGSEWLAHLSDTCMTITHLIGEEKKKRQCLRSTTHRQIITPRSFFSLAARARRLAVIGAKSGETESATEAFRLSLWTAFHKISPLPGGTPDVTTSAGASRAPAPRGYLQHGSVLPRPRGYVSLREVRASRHGAR